mmetsp:Transcript_8723/g.25734  ORF Transcript_8723/g.25734 Transcript_8723/m.25734 type:complete len:202 (+) Transcript_8723:1074-1679(+)
MVPAPDRPVAGTAPAGVVELSLRAPVSTRALTLRSALATSAASSASTSGRRGRPWKRKGCPPCLSSHATKASTSLPDTRGRSTDTALRWRSSRRRRPGSLREVRRDLSDCAASRSARCARSSARLARRRTMGAISACMALRRSISAPISSRACSNAAQSSAEGCVPRATGPSGATAALRAAVARTRSSRSACAMPSCSQRP